MATEELKNTENTVTDEELEAAGGDAALLMEDKDEYTLKLVKPISDCGKEYKELHFDFGKLTGKDCRDIDRELRNLGITVIMRKLSDEFLIRACVKACKEDIGADFFDRLTAKQYCFITNYAKKFF